MYTLVETTHDGTRSWSNKHHEFDTLRDAVMAAAYCPETSTVEIWDESFETVMPLCRPSEVNIQRDRD